MFGGVREKKRMGYWGERARERKGRERESESESERETEDQEGVTKGKGTLVRT